MRHKGALPIGERKLLTLPETMEYTHLSKAAIQDRIDDGRFTTLLDGKRTKVYRESIDNSMLSDMQTQQAKKQRPAA